MNKDRYDTLVVKNATSKVPPMEAAGGEVVAWAVGHELQVNSVLEEFVYNFEFIDYETVEEIQEEAQRVMQKVRELREVNRPA